MQAEKKKNGHQDKIGTLTGLPVSSDSFAAKVTARLFAVSSAALHRSSNDISWDLKSG